MSPVHRTAEDDEILPDTPYIVGMLREQITGVVNQINKWRGEEYHRAP